MLDQEDRDPEAPADLVDPVSELLFFLLRQPGDRLIEQEQLRLGGERAPQLHALLDAVGAVRHTTRAHGLQDIRAELDLRLGVISRLEAGRTQDVRLMDELARCVPDHLWLTTVQQDTPTSLAVEGRTSLDSKASPSGPSRQRSMAISADGRWAVVLSRAGGSLDCSSSEVVLIQFATGELVARWRPNPPCAKFISLSPDGRTVLLSRFAPAGPPSGDIVSVDAHTGEALRWFNSGFHGVNGGAWSAVFTGREQFVAAPAMWNAHPGDSGKALKVFDEQPGGVVRELTYRQFGSLGIVATSWDAPIVAMINYWLTPLENMLGDDFHPKHGVDLLLYRLAESQPFSVLRHLRVGQLGGGPDSYRPRLSGNGSRVAIFQQGSINVYSVPSPEGL